MASQTGNAICVQLKRSEVQICRLYLISNIFLKFAFSKVRFFNSLAPAT